MRFGILFFTFCFSVCFSNEFDDFETATVSDKYERTNRKIYNFNIKFDKYFTHPVLYFYWKLPFEFRDGMADVAYNSLETPIAFYTSLSAKQGEVGLNNLTRFIVNFSLGFLGFFNVADDIGIEKSDFGLSDLFIYYDIPIGQYIVLPILGGGSMRHSVSIPFVVMMSSSALSRQTTGDRKMLMYFFLNENTLLGGLASSPVQDTILSQFYIWSLLSKYKPLEEQVRQSSIDSYSAYKNFIFQTEMSRVTHIKALRQQNKSISHEDNISFTDNRMLVIY